MAKGVTPRCIYPVVTVVMVWLESACVVCSLFSFKFLLRSLEATLSFTLSLVPPYPEAAAGRYGEVVDLRRIPWIEDDAVALVAALFRREYFDLLLLRLSDLPDLLDGRRVFFCYSALACENLNPGKSLIWSSYASLSIAMIEDC